MGTISASFSSLHAAQFKGKSLLKFSPIRRRIPSTLVTLLVTMGRMNLAHYNKAVGTFLKGMR